MTHQNKCGYWVSTDKCFPLNTLLFFCTPVLITDNQVAEISLKTCKLQKNLFFLFLKVVHKHNSSPNITSSESPMLSPTMIADTLLLYIFVSSYQITNLIFYLKDICNYSLFCKEQFRIDLIQQKALNLVSLLSQAVVSLQKTEDKLLWRKMNWKLLSFFRKL